VKETFHAMAVDIGGTKMSAAVVDSNGKVQDQVITSRVPFTRLGAADQFKIIDWIKKQRTSFSEQLSGVGLSICGNVDEENGFVPLSANLHWREIPFGQMVEQACGLPVVAATDVCMAALAEMTWGFARGKKFFAWVTIGTGFGGYLVLDGQLYRGFHGYAGNFGHNTWDEYSNEVCGCGKSGCIEKFVSGPGIAKAGQKKYSSGGLMTLIDKPHANPLRAEDVFKAASLGDTDARAIIDEAIRLTAISLAGLVNILDLEMLVIGGGIAHAASDYVDRISQRIRQYLMTTEAKRDLLVVSEGFTNSALIGSAAAVFLKNGILHNQGWLV